MPDTPVFIVHDLAEARAVLAAAGRTPVRIESAAGAASYAGAAWFNALIRAAMADAPGAKATWVLDCGAEAGAALGAIREGVPAIRTRARASARARLKEIARAAKVAVFEGVLRGALDLSTAPDMEAAIARHLGGAQLKKPRPSAIPDARNSSRNRGQQNRNRRERKNP